MVYIIATQEPQKTLGKPEYRICNVHKSENFLAFM